MSAESKVTTDHQVIKRWVEERDGSPARVKDTDNGTSSGVLRIDYPGYSGEESLETITWDEFFEAFEENNLAFLYQDETKDGKKSRFSKLIDRDSAGLPLHRKNGKVTNTGVVDRAGDGNLPRLPSALSLRS
jgi:hypothetical protein